MRNKGRPLSRTMIVEHVWDMDYDGLTNIVDVYIRHLRSKIDDRFVQKLIHTVRGIGYMIEAPEKGAVRRIAPRTSSRHSRSDDQLQFNSSASRQIEGQYMSPIVAARRQRVLALLGLQSGEAVLDIGSGAGFLADEMAVAVGPSAGSRESTGARTCLLSHGSVAPIGPRWLFRKPMPPGFRFRRERSTRQSPFRSMNTCPIWPPRSVSCVGFCGPAAAPLLWTPIGRRWCGKRKTAARAERVFHAWDEHLTDLTCRGD